MRGSFRIALVGCLLVIAAVGCYRGAKFNFEQIQLIEPGVTTQDEVLRMLGRPMQVSQVTAKQGYFIRWDYYYEPNRGDGAALKVLFDEQGIVYTYDYRLIQR